jgi:FkbM family methyltransferase
MLIDAAAVISTLKFFDVTVTGVLHVGAHECEERPFYHQLGLADNDIIWVDALESKVCQMSQRIPNVYHAVITDKDGDEITFNVANNGQSSSVLEFGTHAQAHPSIRFVDRIKMTTTTLNTFLAKNNIDGTRLNFWNFDIQGAELLALKGAVNYLPYADALYLEVNEKELYTNCALISEIDSFLADFGFKRLSTIMTEHGWGDALYIKLKGQK